MTQRSFDARSFGRALRLRCPRCGAGRLFRGLFRMHDGCGACGLSFRREPGFYLGSIYINYGITVIVTGLLYGAIVLGAGWSNEAALAVCLAVAVLFPILFFRHARSLLLALDDTVNAQQSGAPAGVAGDYVPADPAPGHLARLTADDARAGCMMGVILVLIVLFGILIALVPPLFSGGLSGGPQPASDAVDLAAGSPTGPRHGATRPPPVG